MGDWEKFNETLTEEEDFYSHVNRKYIANAYFTQAKSVCKDFRTLILDNYDLYVQSDAVLLAGVFNNFQEYMSGNIRKERIKKKSKKGFLKNKFAVDSLKQNHIELIKKKTD